MKTDFKSGATSYRRTKVNFFFHHAISFSVLIFPSFFSQKNKRTEFLIENILFVFLTWPQTQLNGQSDFYIFRLLAWNEPVVPRDFIQNILF